MNARRRRASGDVGGGPCQSAHPSESGFLHQLRDGAHVLVRPLMESDREELATRYGQLSAQSRRLRFGSAPDRLSESALDHLVELDYDDRYALAAFMIDEPGTPGVGVARYSRVERDGDDDGDVAEVAVTVLDDYQQRGVGTALLNDLVDVARAHGITTLLGTVLWENEDLLDALRAHGAVVEPSEPGVATVRVEVG